MALSQPTVLSPFHCFRPMSALRPSGTSARTGQCMHPTLISRLRPWGSPSLVFLLSSSFYVFTGFQAGQPGISLFQRRVQSVGRIGFPRPKPSCLNAARCSSRSTNWRIASFIIQCTERWRASPGRLIRSCISRSILTAMGTVGGADGSMVGLSAVLICINLAYQLYYHPYPPGSTEPKCHQMPSPTNAACRIRNCKVIVSRNVFTSSS